MRVSIDSDGLCGAVELLRALTLINLRDAHADPRLAADLLRTVETPGALVYASDQRASPFHTDEWASFRVLRQRWGAGPIFLDCEDMIAIVVARVLLRDPSRPVFAAITQPTGTNEAHAHGMIARSEAELVAVGGDPWRLSVLDPCIERGMPAPRSGLGWYGQGTRAALRVRPPEACHDR